MILPAIIKYVAQTIKISSRLASHSAAAEERADKAESEVARLKTMHCPECGNDVFTRRDTGGQQCLECGTAIGPFIAAAEERGAKMYAKFIADFYAITGADTEWFDRWLAARAALAGEEVES